MASRIASRAPSRKATFIETSGSRVPSRRQTFRQNNRSRTSSRYDSATSTPHLNRKPTVDPEVNRESIYTIDLNNALNRRLQQTLSDRIEGDSQEKTTMPQPGPQPVNEVIDYEAYSGDFEFGEDFDDDMDEEFYDEEEEKTQRLQFLRERRFSVFPIA